MLYTRFHAIWKLWLPTRMAVIGAVLAEPVPLSGQQPLWLAGRATPDAAATSQPKQSPTSSSATSAKTDPNAEVTVQDSGTTCGLRVNLVHVRVRQAIPDSEGSQMSARYGAVAAELRSRSCARGRRFR